MTIPRETVVALLPCYLCDDLPDHIAAAVEEALATDADLQSRLEALTTGRDACLEALTAVAPELAAWPELDAPAPPHPSVPPTQPWGLAVGIAAAVLLAITAGRSPAPALERTLAAESTAIASEDGALLRASSPQALAAALRAAGVAPQLAVVPDLSAMGFQLVGARPTASEDSALPGVAVVYERNGERVVCRIHTARPTDSRPDATRTVEGITLRGFEHDSGAVVAWSSGGRWCLFSGPMPLAALLDAVAARIG